MVQSSRMHFCLVCHTEPDVWDGEYTSIDIILPKFTRIIEDIQDDTGVTPRVAWCLTSQVVQNRPKPFLALLDKGHEIGVHSHFPGASGIIEHQQEINISHLDNFSNWFPELCSKIVDAGFPAPRTHVTWMFAYRDTMTDVLADAKIEVDCSVCYGGAHYLSDGSLLADSRDRKSGKPYRLALSDHCTEGHSPVVELPVSGGLGSYWELNKKGEFRYFSPVASDAEMERQLQLLQKRLGMLLPQEIDIFQVHFHLYEFLTPNGISEERLERTRRLLSLMAQDNRVCFSTPSEAVGHWSGNNT